MQKLLLTNIVIIVISFPIIQDTTEWLGFSLVGYLYYPLIPLLCLNVPSVYNELKSDRLTKNKLFIIFVIICCFVLSAWFHKMTVELEASLRQIVALFLFSSSFLILQLSKTRVIWLLKVFFLGSVVGSFIILFSYFEGNMVGSTVRGTTIGGDANETAIFMSIACVIGLFLMHTNRNAMYGIMTLFPAAGCMLTGSRTGFLALSAGLILYIIFKFSFNKRKVITIIIPILFVLMLLYVIPNDIILRFFTIVEEIGDKRIEGRVGLWEKALEIFSLSPVYGNGFDTFTSLYEYYYSTEWLSARNAHNVFLKVLIEFGIIGEIVLITIIGKILFRVKIISNKDEKFLLLGILFSLLFSFVTLSWIYYPSVWYFLLVLSRLEDFERQKEPIHKYYITENEDTHYRLPLFYARF